MPIDTEGRILRMLDIQKSVSIELYKYCLLVGFDPETFNYKDYSENNLSGIQFNENSFLLKGYSEKMVKIEKILEKLNNEELL